MDAARHVMARNDTNQVNIRKIGYINSNSLSKLLYSNLAHDSKVIWAELRITAIAHR
jgi:hypothetical protein